MDRKIQIGGLSIIGFFFVIFFFYPSAQLFVSAFSLSQSDLDSVLSDPSLKSALRFTWLQSILSSLIACALGLCIGIPLGLRPANLKSTRVITSLLEATFALPSLVIVSLFTMWLGRHGFLNQTLGFLGIENQLFESMYGPVFVIAAHVFYNAGFVATLVSGAVSRIGFSECALIRSLGGSRSNMFQIVFVPTIRPVIWQAFSQVYLLSLSSFSIVLLLGGGPPTESLETLIYSEMKLGGLNFSKAAILALFQIFLSLMILPFIGSFARNSGQRSGRNSGQSLGKMGGMTWSNCQKKVLLLRDVMVFIGLALLVFPFGGFVVSVIESIKHIEWNSFLSEMAPFLYDSIRLSLVVAMLSTFFVFVAIVLSLRKHMMTDRQMVRFDTLANIPSFVSSMCLAMGIFLAFSKWFNVWTYGFWFLAGFLTVLTFPMGVRILRPTSLWIRPIQVETLRNLGAGFTEIVRYVYFPEMKSNLVYFFFLIVASTFAEVSAASLLSSDSFTPLSVYVVRLFSEYRLEEANVIVCSYFFMNAALFTWVKGFQKKRTGE